MPTLHLRNMRLRCTHVRSGLPMSTILDACYALAHDCRSNGTRFRLGPVLESVSACGGGRGTPVCADSAWQSALLLAPVTCWPPLEPVRASASAVLLTLAKLHAPLHARILSHNPRSCGSCCLWTSPPRSAAARLSP